MFCFWDRTEQESEVIAEDQSSEEWLLWRNEVLPYLSDPVCLWRPQHYHNTKLGMPNTCFRNGRQPSERMNKGKKEQEQRRHFHISMLQLIDGIITATLLPKGEGTDQHGPWQQWQQGEGRTPLLAAVLLPPVSLSTRWLCFLYQGRTPGQDHLVLHV